MPTFKHLTKNYANEMVVVFLLIAASIPTILWMSDRWFIPDSYYSHGFLVPLITLFIIWRKRYELEKLPFVPSRWGFRTFLLGISLYWTSALLHVYFSSAIAMLIITIGLIGHIYGKKTLQEILFPILFLVFMIPLPLIVVAYICFKLKIVAAQLATLMLNILGFGAVQLSSYIKLTHSYVLVEDSCGGLRSLVSLMALGSIFAYQLNARFIKKMILFAMAVPIAIVTNASRIVFLSIIGEVWGAQYAQGILHTVSGYLVFAFAFLFLFVLKKILEYEWPK